MTTIRAPLPSARSDPFIASTGELVYLWGGLGDTEPETVFVYRYGTETWTRQPTKGPHPPAGLSNGGCTMSGKFIFLYGGYDGRSCHKDLYQLNTHNWRWRKVSDGGAGGPGEKTGCRMISYRYSLLIVGGKYDKKPKRHAGSSYEYGWTNEVHSYNLSTGKNRIIVLARDERQLIH